MTEKNNELSILFVCMGNICRSPMAEGVCKYRLAQRQVDTTIVIDSAATHGYHEGSPPDRRAQAAAARRGIDISAQVSRHVQPDDFERFDVILAMDTENLEYLLRVADPGHHGKIRLFLDYSDARKGGEVPDPYYGGPAGFERVLDLIEDAVDGLLDELTERVAASR